MQSPTPTAPPPQESDRPFPPRFWWLKRIGITCSAVLLILLGVRGWEVHRAAKELQAELDAARALGEPVDVADLTKGQSFGSANAADVLRRAASLVKDLDSLRADPSALPPDEDSAEGKKLFEQWVDANAAALALAHRARGLRNADWQLRLTSPLLTQNTPDLRQQRELAEVLSEAAIVSHRRGDDAAAVEYLLDMLTLARAVRSIPTGMGYVVSVVTFSWARDALEKMPDLQVASKPLSHQRNPASPQQIQGLIRELAEEDGPGDLARALMERRVVALDLVHSSALQGGDVADRLIVWLFEPVTSKHDVWIMKYFDQAIAAARQAQTYPALEAKFPVRPPRPPTTPFLVRMHLMAFSPEYLEEKLPELHFREVAIRRLEAAALADKLYRIEHGQAAVTINELIPYLPNGPQDPFDASGSLILMSKNPPRRLYSVGPNGRDDQTGATTQGGQSDDIVVPLEALSAGQDGDAGQLPTTSPTSQPVDVPGDPGKADRDRRAE